MLLGREQSRSCRNSKLGRETAAEQNQLQPLLRKVCIDGAELT